MSNFITWVDDDKVTSGTQEPTTFSSDIQRQNGFQAGKKASAIRVNTALRQSTLVTAALMNAIANTSKTNYRSTVSAVQADILSGLKAVKVNNSGKADNATNVTTNINGKSISTIFEKNGTTVKNSTNSSNVTDTINNLPISSLFDEYGRSIDALEVNGLKIIRDTDNVLKINNLMPTVIIPTKVVLTNTTKLLSIDNDVSLYRPQIVNDIMNHKLIFKFLFTMSGGKQNITVFTKPIEINSLKSTSMPGTSMPGTTTSISGIFVETFKVFANIGTEAETSIRIYYNSYSGGIIGKIISKNSDIEKIEFKELCMMYD